MKNILTENMKRFGTKNLTESNIQKLNEAALNEVDFLRNSPDSNWANKQPETKKLLQMLRGENRTKHLNGFTTFGPYILRWDPAAFKRFYGRDWKPGSAHTAYIIGFTADNGGDSGVPRMMDIGTGEEGVAYLESTGWKSFQPNTKKANTGPAAVNKAYAPLPADKVYAAFDKFYNLTDPRYKAALDQQLSTMFPQGKDSGTNAGITGKARAILQKLSGMVTQTGA